MRLKGRERLWAPQSKVSHSGTLTTLMTHYVQNDEKKWHSAVYSSWYFINTLALMIPTSNRFLKNGNGKQTRLFSKVCFLQGMTPATFLCFWAPLYREVNLLVLRHNDLRNWDKLSYDFAWDMYLDCGCSQFAHTNPSEEGEEILKGRSISSPSPSFLVFVCSHTSSHWLHFYDDCFPPLICTPEWNLFCKWHGLCFIQIWDRKIQNKVYWDKKLPFELKGFLFINIVSDNSYYKSLYVSIKS